MFESFIENIPDLKTTPLRTRLTELPASSIPNNETATRVTVPEKSGDITLYCNSTADKLQFGSNPLRQSQHPSKLSSHLCDHYAESTANKPSKRSALEPTSDNESETSVAESEWDVDWDNYIDVNEDLFLHPERLDDIRFPKD